MRIWVFTSLLSLLGASGLAIAADAPLPIRDLAGVTLRASSLDDMRAFYGKGAGFKELPRSKDGPLRFAVGADQWLEFEPGSLKEYVIRFQSVTLTASNLRDLEGKLRERGVVVARLPRASGRPDTLEVRDPFGQRLLFVEAAKGKPTARPAPGFSQHLQHVGLIVHHDFEKEAERFYGETLGLAESFRMKDKGGRPTLIKYRLPGDRGDVIELIFVWGPINKWAAGSAYHVNFSVDDIDAAYCKLFHGGIANEDRHMPKVNAERLWAVDLIDPEQTRMEVQVPTAASQDIGASTNPACSGPSEDAKLFDGKSLAGWKGEEGYWRVEDGQIVGEAKTYMHYNSFLWHDSPVKDFYLSVWIKQTPSRDRNSGIQFRSHHIGSANQARGYQADVGTGLWGRLYHEEGREHLFRTDVGEKAVNWDDWNHYEILAVGHRIWTAVNGTLSVAVDDPKGELAGNLALQIHFGGPQVVRFKDLKLLRNPPVALAGLDEAELVKRLQQVKEEKGR